MIAPTNPSAADDTDAIAHEAAGFRGDVEAARRGVSPVKALPDLTDEQRKVCDEIAAEVSTRPSHVDDVALAAVLGMREGIALGQQAARDVQAEPVAWQRRTTWRRKVGPWWDCDRETYDAVIAAPNNRDEARALYSAPPASDVQAEPVAWMYEGPSLAEGKHLLLRRTTGLLGDGTIETPLYAAPQASDVQAKLAELIKMTEVQKSACDCVNDPYFRGMANGMIFAQSVLEGHDAEPQYIEGPPASDVQPIGAVPDLRDGRVPEGWPTDHMRIAKERAAFEAQMARDEVPGDLRSAAWLGWQARAAAPALQGEFGATFVDGIEAAAKVVEGGSHLHDSAPSAVWARQVAKLIRALAPQPTPSGATVADQRDAARWISVEDRLPTEEKEYVHNLLVVSRYGNRDVATYDGWAKYFDMGSTSALGGHPVTHWMPLPLAPTAAQDAAGEQS